ncbi:hypothetical protein [Acinetobacter higginsii]|uniref:hypothetical protein n=1 Tax=Acinetobacter higginsii TaxID=70347 RepID=UPI001F4B4BFB|nr:hypothetical protein [Acinetobacter higginsii]MCH7339924.1 hypothetical protein [Acinetobacter higginsii]
MRLSVSGLLPVAMTVLVANKAVKCKSVELTDVTTGELFEARKQAKENEFIAIAEFVAKAKLLDDKGNQHAVTYEMLRDMSSANFKKLEDLDYQLQVKLNAESLENQSS